MIMIGKCRIAIVCAFALLGTQPVWSQAGGQAARQQGKAAANHPPAKAGQAHVPAKPTPWQLELDQAQAVMSNSAQAYNKDTMQFNLQELEARMSRSEQHLRTALKLATSGGGPLDQSIVAAKLAFLLLNERQPGEALGLFQQAMANRKRANPADTLEVAELYGNMAMCKSSMMEQKDTMIDDIHNAYDIYSRLIPADDQRLLVATKMLAEYAPSPAEAVPYRRQIVQIELKNYADRAPQLIGAEMFVLAIALGNSGQLNEAIQQAQQAIEWTSKQPGMEPYCGYIKNTMDHWKRQLVGAEPAWGVIYHNRFAGRNPRSKPDNPNPPTVATSNAAPSASRPGYSATQPRPHHRRHGAPSWERESQPGQSSSQPAPPEIALGTPPVTPPMTFPTPPPPVQSARPAAPPPAPRRPRHHSDAPEAGGMRYYADGHEISKDAYDAMLLSNEACSLLAKHQYAEAKTKLTDAVSLDADLSSAHANLGLALSKLGQNDEAVNQLKIAIQAEPDKASPLAMLASVYQSTGQLDNAVATYRQYAQKFPGEADVPVLKALAADLDKVSAVQHDVLAKNPGADSASDYLPYCTTSGRVRWRKGMGPIKVYIQSGDGVKNFDPAFDKCLHDAFAEWVKGMGGAISVQYVSSKKESNIDCFFTDNFSQVQSIAEGGEAQMTWTTDGNMSHCTIVLLTAHAADNLPPSVNEIKGVCLHEIGHALGLNGHSPNSNDIMYCSETGSESRRPQLTDRDLATLKKLYG